MRKKRITVSSILILLLLSMVGCKNNKEAINYEDYLFNLTYGKEITTEYFNNIINGDIEGANSLCEDELVAKNSEISLGTSEITSFQLYRSLEGSNYGYYIYDAIRSDGDKPKADLERYILKVIRNGEKYEISEIKAKAQKRLYVKDNSLRVVGEKGVDSKLVINLNGIPDESYLKSNDIMIYKENVPKDSFGEIGIGFTGNKIAISTTNKESSYICIAIIDEEVTTSIDPSNSENSSTDNLQSSTEKSVAKQLIPLDLLNGGSINKFVFSKDDENISVNYSIDGTNRVNIYNANSGDIISTKLEESFPKDKYNIYAKYFKDNNIVIDVENRVDNNSENIEYIFNLETLEMKKL